MTATEARARPIAALATRVAQLRADVLRIKRTIRHLRDELADKAAELEALETECANRGQALIIRKGAGATHGQPDGRHTR